MLRWPPKVAATVATAAACARWARATRTMQLLAFEGPFSDLKLVIMIIMIINMFGRDYSTVVIITFGCVVWPIHSGVSGCRPRGDSMRELHEWPDAASGRQAGSRATGRQGDG